MKEAPLSKTEKRKIRLAKTLAEKGPRFTPATKPKTRKTYRWRESPALIVVSFAPLADGEPHRVRLIGQHEDWMNRQERRAEIARNRRAPTQVSSGWARGAQVWVNGSELKP